MLLVEQGVVDEEFSRIVEGLDAPAPVPGPAAKMKPMEEDGNSRQEEMEPWEDEDDAAGIDIEWP
ncbi:hypothetical protein [Nocardiopsis potens]|uniref:hypothetical protein n=1 Tax=Nocardiopsis potens TaxID=1246458 RepID=UPI00034B3D3E|nr:hypothetical protein [Nocardiopsis potens]